MFMREDFDAKFEAAIITFICFFGIVIIIGITLFLEMLNDHRCTQLPYDEFIKDTKCERYKEYRKN